MVTIRTGFYDFELVSTQVVDFGTSEHDKYRMWEDEKYLKFLKKHGFRQSYRVHDLYLRLCAAGLVD